MSFSVSRQRGFGFIETMISVTILALLSTIIISNVQEGRKKARDTQRLSDLQQIQLALRLYKDANERYPVLGCGVTSATDPLSATTEWTGPGPGSANWYNSCSDYIPGLVPQYIQTLPNDPLSENDSDKGYLYEVNQDGTDYKLLVHQTVEKGIINAGESFARCPVSCLATHNARCSGQNSYAVYSPGAACW